MSRIPYDLTKIKGMAFDVDGVLSPVVVPLGLNGLPNRMVNLRDGYALQLAVKKGFHMAIISGARASGIEQRFESLGFQTVVMEAKNKVEVLSKWMADNALKPEEVVYAGDDVPDLGAVILAGVGVAPADACTDILEAADYISPYAGGYGVGRDIVEQVMRAQRIWPVEGCEIESVK